jgi:hypothetical protein
MNIRHSKHDDSSTRWPHIDAPSPFPLSDAGERKREEVRATLHRAISRRVFARRAAHTTLAALALLGVTWLAMRTAITSNSAVPAHVPIARSTSPDNPLAASPTSPPDASRLPRPSESRLPTVAIVRDDPRIIARLSITPRPSRIEPLDDAQLLAELRPVRGDVGLVRVAGRVDIVDATGTTPPTRGKQVGTPTYPGFAATFPATFTAESARGTPCL